MISPKFLIVCVFLSALLGATFSQLISQARSAHAQTDREVIRASAFEVVDDNGMVLARLAASGPGETSNVGLSFYDKRGRNRASFGTQGDSTMLSFLDENGTYRLTMAALSEGWPLLAFTDEHDVTRILIAVAPNDGPAIVFKDEYDNRIWKVP